MTEQEWVPINGDTGMPLVGQFEFWRVRRPEGDEIIAAIHRTGNYSDALIVELRARKRPKSSRSRVVASLYANSTDPDSIPSAARTIMKNVEARKFRDGLVGDYPPKKLEV